MKPCLSEDVVAALVEGALEGAAFEAAERHLGECERCARLVGEVGRAVTSGDGGAPSRAPAAEPGPGTRVGRYEILATIGAGGMGSVYAARDPALDRKVALKLLHPTAATAALEARLLREAKAMARLSHPEIITVHDVGHYGEQLFIAMELIDGGTLRQWLASKPRAWAEVLAVYLRAGRGLAQAHAAGIVHRDFKPDNVLVGADGRVRVTDFGLARTGPSDAYAVTLPEGVVDREDGAKALGEDALTRTGALVGTPAYMAPEQHAGAPADVRSDIYGFCVSLYEGLSGERPFKGTSLAELYAAKLTGRVAPPTRTRAPGRLFRALAVGLRPKAEDRYESMDALLGALARAARPPQWPRIAGAAVVLTAAASVFAARRTSTTHAPPAAAAPTCTNRGCVASHGGVPFVCRASDHACIPVASEDCVAKYEPKDLASDDTVWLGAMLPATGPSAQDFGTMDMDAIDMARAEIAQATRAFDGSTAARPVRRIALVACDDAADATRAAEHLADVGVPAIMGFRSGQEVVDLAGSLFMARDVLSIATVTANPLVTRLPQPADRPRMVWRTTYNADAVAVTIGRFVETLAPRYPAGAMRVTLVRSDTPGAFSFAGTLFKELRYNGKSALENGGGYTEVALAPGGDVGAAAARVVASRPSVVVLQGVGDDAVVPVVERVEAQMAAAAHRPTYLAALYPMSSFADLIGASADRRRRVYGFESTSTSPANARFVIHYNETHDPKVTRTINGGASYDAFYVLSYATFALGAEPVTGPALAKAFGRLVGPGPSIQVGPTAVFDALSALTQGGRVDLEGTQSGLDFDLATGDEPSDFAVLCSGVDAHGRADGEDVESGLIYRAATGKLEGVMRCP